MFVKLSQFIQKVQRVFYKPTTHTYKLHNEKGKIFILRSEFLQKKGELIDLRSPVIQDFNITHLQDTPCKKYNEFFSIQEIKDI